MYLCQVTSRRFCAGFLHDGKYVKKAAPILRRHIMGQGIEDVRKLCRRKHWTLKELDT